MFKRVFWWERKRAERSGRCFLLALVQVESVLQANRGERALPEILSALSSSTRETDIIGWYQKDAFLGIIFTDIREADNSTLPSSVRAKLKSALGTRLDTEQVDQIRFSFHFFPDHGNQTNFTANRKFYPELYERDEARRFSCFVKRCMDIVGSILGLILFFPLFVAISLAIKLTSNGPILFKQERVGRYGSQFTFLKFRSMKCANDPTIHREFVKRFIAGKTDLMHHGASQKAVYKIQEDARVTRLGKFLRQSSLDELPQLINVLKGEMSLVGPRPPIPYELEEYQPWHRRRVLEVKPGITGLWQVNGRSRVKFDDMVRLDLRYSKTWSLWLDIKILLQTPPAVLFGTGAH